MGWGEERAGEKCKEGIVMGEGGEDVVRGGDEVLGRRASVRKLSLSRRQSRDLLKKKISFEEQVLLVLAQYLVQVLLILAQVQVQVLIVLAQDLVQV